MRIILITAKIALFGAIYKTNMNSKEITQYFSTGTVFKLAVFSAAFLTAMAVYAQEASTRYSYHRHPEATAILLDSGGNEKSPRLSELQ